MAEKKGVESLLGWFGIGSTALGLIFAFGTWRERTDQQDHRIVVLETWKDQAVPTLARIDANLQYLTDRQKERDQRGRE